jgi:hypothetical protein
MTVATSTAALNDLLNTHKAQKDRILSDSNLTQEGKMKSLGALNNQNLPRAEGLLQALWGKIEEPNPGQYYLGAGAAWVELESADRRLQDALQAAGREGLDPAFIPLATSRAKAVASRATDPAGFLKSYKHEAPDVRIMLQEMGGDLLSDKTGVDWNRVKNTLEADRTARLETAPVISARNNLEAIMTNLDDAYRATERITAAFADTSWIASNILRGVKRERRMINGPVPMMSLEFDRKPFGVTWQGNRLTVV